MSAILPPSQVAFGRRPIVARLRTIPPYYVLSGVVFLTFLANGTTGPFLALYAGSLGASLVQISWIVGGFATASLAANLFWGRISDRIGRRKPLIVGAMAVLICTNLIVAHATSWWVLLPLRLIEGLALAAYNVASLALMGDILEGHPRRARMVGGYRMTSSLAFSIAIVVAGYIAERYGFATTFTAASGIYLVALLVSLSLPETKSTSRTDARGKTSIGELLRGPMLPLLIVALAHGIPFSAIYSIWPVWVADYLGLGRAVYGQLWGLAAFLEVPCMLLAGRAIERYGRGPTFAAGMSLFAVVYVCYSAALLLPVPLYGLVAAQVIRAFAYAAFWATALTMAVEVAPPDARGRAAGLFQNAQSLSQILGNYAGGPIAQGVGFPSLYVGSASVVIVGAVYIATTLRRSPSVGREAGA